jgi:YD repeat-containing protein
LVSTNRARVSTTDPNLATANTTGQCPTGFLTTSWQSEQHSYFPTGNLKTVTDANADVTTYAYDPVGRQQVVQDGDGRQTATVYDLAGQVVATWHGGGGWIDTATGLPAAGNIPATWTPSSYSGTGPLPTI